MSKAPMSKRRALRPSDFASRFGLRYTCSRRAGLTLWRYGYGGKVTVPREHWPLFDRDAVLPPWIAGVLLHEAMHALDDRRPYELVKLASLRHRIARGERAYAVSMLYLEAIGEYDLAIEMVDRAAKRGTRAYAAIARRANAYERPMRVHLATLLAAFDHDAMYDTVPEYAEPLLRWAIDGEDT